MEVVIVIRPLFLRRFWLHTELVTVTVLVEVLVVVEVYEVRVVLVKRRPPIVEVRTTVFVNTVAVIV